MVAYLRLELLHQPFEPILHPSPWRNRLLGTFTLVGHPLFAWIWGVWLKQPYENYELRAIMSGLGLILLLPRISRDPTSSLSQRAFGVIFWIQLPIFFTWMYLCNDGNLVWLASECAMVLIYYHVTDWRAASVGMILGVGLANVSFQLWGPSPFAITPTQWNVNFVILSFCWASAMVLGISSANLRREQLKNTLATIGIMAHELRTPLATMALIGDAMRSDVVDQDQDPMAQRQTMLASRLHTLVRNMNHQIDMQIGNARLLSLPRHKEVLSADALVQTAIKLYPYRNSKERESVEVVVHDDFVFAGSPTLYAQVIDNLLKNAFRSLASSARSSHRGDLHIEIGTFGDKGHILVSDRGVGIAPDLQARIFEPFFSTDSGTGHGLGLAFCRRVVDASKGRIHVQSEVGRGATFTIELPLIIDDVSTIY